MILTLSNDTQPQASVPALGTYLDVEGTGKEGEDTCVGEKSLFDWLGRPYLSVASLPTNAVIRLAF